MGGGFDGTPVVARYPLGGGLLGSGLLGGATATILRGRGALQDIDQMALVRPHVKLAVQVKKVRDLAPTLDRAFRVAS